MPSPFPGMDPFIESQREWPDFHSDLAGEIRARLNQDLQATNGGSVAVIDPPLAQSQVPVEVELRIVSVEVREVDSDRLVTAIEILSPVNKRNGPQRDKYLQKRQELFRSLVHVMEIDLLRVGHRSPLEIEPPPAPYYITLGRGNRRPAVDIWPVQLDEKLPRVPVPLTPPDPDVVLDLNTIAKDVYERGAYARRLDYSQQVPSPRLDQNQQEWVDNLLSSYRQTT